MSGLALAVTACNRTTTVRTEDASPKILLISTRGDELKFNKTLLEARAGIMITLRFTNNASSASEMRHNWVLTHPNKEEQVAIDGIRAGELKGYLNRDTPSVIAAIPLVKPGETGEVSFIAPPPGRYPYICTFPGHYTLMHGILEVKI